jgi:hypothetical protein
MTSRRSYMDDWSTPRICIRLIFVLAAVIGLWISLWLGASRWEILFAAYFVVQNVEHAAHQIRYELGRR